MTHLDAGTYTLDLHDHSAFHNFHLSGPGVDVSTSVDAIEDKTFTVTLTDGTYFFNCDPHSSQMKGTFTVGKVTTPLPPAPPAAAAKLAAAIGPGSKATLRPLAGISAGKTIVTVRDTSATDGFRLSGPGARQDDQREVPRHGEVGGDALGGPLFVRQRSECQASQGVHDLGLTANRLRPHRGAGGAEAHLRSQRRAAPDQARRRAEAAGLHEAERDGGARSERLLRAELRRDPLRLRDSAAELADCLCQLGAVGAELAPDRLLVSGCHCESPPR